MGRTILITGGAGFIGSHLADRLLARGDRVRVLDSLLEQVHGPAAGAPAHLDPEVDLQVGDVADPDAVTRALDGVDAVVHLAASVGVGQSMYRIADYTAGNDLGTAVLLERLRARPVARLVVASSMSIYGEGLYRDADGVERGDVARDFARVEAGAWDPVDAQGRPLTPVPTSETKRPDLVSVYALGKYVQERLCLVVGGTSGIPTVALRFFNVFGPRQALANPYTGVMANFAVRLLNGRPPLIFEDGEQRRDFVHVDDAVSAIVLALDAQGAAGRCFNIASGASVTVHEVAARLAEALGRSDIAPEATGQFRAGDVRHCFADISLAADVLGYRPKVTLKAGIEGLVDWLRAEAAANGAVDRVESARRELHLNGLAR